MTTEEVAAAEIDAALQATLLKASSCSSQMHAAMKEALAALDIPKAANAARCMHCNGFIGATRVSCASKVAQARSPGWNGIHTYTMLLPDEFSGIGKATTAQLLAKVGSIINNNEQP